MVLDKKLPTLNEVNKKNNKIKYNNTKPKKPKK